jgi:hypothetical protein
VNIVGELDVSEAQAALDRLDDELAALLPQWMRQSLDAVAATARETTSFTDRSGALRNSIGRGPGGVYEVDGDADGITGAVGTGVSYGAHIEFGTKAHMVRPKLRTALRWPTAGGFGFSKGHMVSGIQAREFLQGALDARFPGIVDELTAVVQLAALRAGLGGA